LKAATNRDQKMKLDNDLRMSYKFNQHDQLSFGKKNKKNKKQE
jgi:hypothetical protein